MSYAPITSEGCQQSADAAYDSWVEFSQETSDYYDDGIVSDYIPPCHKEYEEHPAPFAYTGEDLAAFFATKFNPFLLNKDPLQWLLNTARIRSRGNFHLSFYGPIPEKSCSALDRWFESDTRQKFMSVFKNLPVYKTVPSNAHHFKLILKACTDHRYSTPCYVDEVESGYEDGEYCAITSLNDIENIIDCQNLTTPENIAELGSKVPLTTTTEVFVYDHEDNLLGCMEPIVSLYPGAMEYYEKHS